ncbi:hypothetical protein GCM10027422_34110 [Hymenobacter arcticus]
MNGVFNRSIVEIPKGKLLAGGFIMPYHMPLMNGMYAELFEQLLLFDKVSFMLGPIDSTPVAALFDRFTLDDLEKALSTEAIEIVLPSVMSIVNTGAFGEGEKNPALLKKGPPVLYGRPSDFGPERLITEALAYTNKFFERDKEAIVKMISPYIKLGPLEDGDNANKFVLEAYNSNSLAPIGMPFQGDAFDFDVPTRMKFQRHVSDVEDLLFTAERDYGLYKIPSVYSIAKQTIGNIEDALNVQNSNDKILTEHFLPNLRLLYTSGRASFKTAMALRDTPENIRFREWLPTISAPNEREYVMRKYTAAIARPIGYTESFLGKLVKGLAMQGPSQLVSLSAGIVAAAAVSATPVGLIPGAAVAAGSIVKALTEVTGNIYLDKVAGYVLNGWTPFQFVEKLQEVVEGKK